MTRTVVSTTRGAWLALVLVVAACVLLPRLGARDAWAPDEPRHAEVARETLRDGHWWYPHVNSHPYPDKPPLYFWLAAAAGAPAGDVTEWSARIPAAISALLTLLLVALLGCRLAAVDAGQVARRHAGMLAGLALTTTWLFAWMGRRVSLDVLLSLLVVLTIWCGLNASDAARAGRRRALLGWLCLAGCAAGLSVMTKGPVGLLFIAFALVALALEDRRDRAPWPAVGGIALLAALSVVLLAWLIPAHVFGGYDPFAVAQDQVVDRATHGRDHVRPFYYYLTTLPLDALPWSLFAIPALVSAWHARRERGVGLLLAWALGPVAVLSIVVEKRNIYLLPLLPAWILLITRWVMREPTPPGPWMRRVESGAWLLVQVLAAGLVFLHGNWSRPEWPLGPRQLVELLAGVAGGVLLAMLLRRLQFVARRDTWPRLTGLAGAFAVALLTLFLFLPSLNSRKSGRTMGEAITRIVGTAPLAMYPRTWDAYVFYSRRSMADLRSPEAVREFIGGSPRPAYILLYRHDQGILDALDEPATEVAADDVGHREIVLFRVGGQ